MELLLQKPLQQLAPVPQVLPVCAQQRDGWPPTLAQTRPTQQSELVLQSDGARRQQTPEAQFPLQHSLGPSQATPTPRQQRPDSSQVTPSCSQQSPPSPHARPGLEQQTPSRHSPPQQSEACLQIEPFGRQQTRIPAATSWHAAACSESGQQSSPVHASPSCPQSPQLPWAQASLQHSPELMQASADGLQASQRPLKQLMPR
jgi:hypothetical protein